MLAPCHAIDLVIDNKGREIQVPACGMYEMIATNGQGIPITHDGDHSQRRVGQFDPGGKGQDPSVSRVQGIKINVHWHAT